MPLSPEKRNFVQLVPHSPIVLLFTFSTLFSSNTFTVAFPSFLNSVVVYWPDRLCFL